MRERERGRERVGQLDDERAGWRASRGADRREEEVQEEISSIGRKGSRGRESVEGSADAGAW